MENQCFKCKYCNQTFNFEDLSSHYKRCQQQIKTDQENNSKKISQQKNDEENEDLYGDSYQSAKISWNQKKQLPIQANYSSSIIKNDGQKNLQEASNVRNPSVKSQILQQIINSDEKDVKIQENNGNIEKQSNQIIEEKKLQIENDTYGQCIYCQKNFLIQNLDDHYDNCEAAQYLISQQICEQEDVHQQQQKEDSQDSSEDYEDVEEQILEGGIIKRTIINKDERTGFTHYRTYYKYPNRHIQHELEEDFRDEQFQEDKPHRRNQRNPLVEITYQPSNSLSEEHTQCCICYEKYQKNQKLTLLDCMHRFHKKCIYIWLEQKSSCPVCKFEVNDYF